VAVAPVAPVSPSAQPAATTNPEPLIAPETAAPTVPAPAPAIVQEPRINHFLSAMPRLGASDLHLSSNVVPMMRHDGDMRPLKGVQPLTNAQLRELIREILPGSLAEHFEAHGDADFAHTIPGVSRYRINAFVDRHGAGVVCRRIPLEILTPEQIGLPAPVLDLCWLSKGLVLVTGPTGSGKSTTLASLIDTINQHRTDHVITIEDPIEFVHENRRCLINQREVRTHTRSFSTALRAALREDPDVVLVGEMRDLETIAVAIETAETGHLVFATLHTTTAISTVDRIIDQFPAEQQSQIRVMLSESLAGVVSQVLCKKEDGGRCAAYEVMIPNGAIANLIRDGKTHQIASALQTGKTQGMQTMNDDLFRLVKEKLVSPQEAYLRSSDKAGIKLLFNQAGIRLTLGGRRVTS